MSEQVQISAPITVDELAQAIDVSATDVVAELMKNGVMATINDTIDFETASIVADDLGVPVVEAEEPEVEPSTTQGATVLDEGEGEPRPPVVAVLGHVDHGKTTLLDALRESDIAAREAGGITQHVSAYQINRNDRAITFLDTPGHEAFSVMREHGAQLTDVAIVVVAADDGFKPQTEESLRYVRQSGVGLVVAINKIDAPEADSNRVKQQLAEHNLLPEEWGGETVVVEISAKQQQNLDQLLDMVLLVADMEDIRARIDGPAEGTVIESQMVRGKGVVATVLLQHGVLRPGNFVVAGHTYARVRSLEDFNGQRIAQAHPSTPVAVDGWKDTPSIGALVVEYGSEKEAKAAVNEQQVSRQRGGGATQAEALTAAMAQSNVPTVPVVIKADVDGSLTAVQQSLESIQTDEVKVDVVGSGVGPVTESDVTLAESAEAIIIGFGVKIPSRVKQLADKAGVEVAIYDVIYELIEDVRERLSALLAPEVIEDVKAELTVKGVFKTAQKEVICGGQVTSGKLVPGLHVRTSEGDYIGTVSSLKREQQDAKEIIQGEMCGVSIATSSKAKLKEEDKLEFFTREEKQRSV